MGCLETNKMPEKAKPRFVMERKGKLEDLDRSFDLMFWQAQDDTARFATTWEMVVLAHRLKGYDDDQLRLQRSVESFQRLPD